MHATSQAAPCCSCERLAIGTVFANVQCCSLQTVNDPQLNSDSAVTAARVTLVETTDVSAPPTPVDSLAATSQMPTLEDAEADRFEMLDRIGIGGMAEVFEARDREGRKVALKVLLPQLSRQRDFVGMFVDEAAVGLRLRHPNIAAVYEAGRLEQRPYLAVEYVDGRSLLQLRLARQEPLPLAVLLHIALAICQALRYAHTLADDDGTPLRIVHRDVTPDNVLVGRDGSVKLIDFGIARCRDRLTRTVGHRLKGKPGYLAPEQILNEPVDHRADLFALGVVLYELATGSDFFAGINPFTMLSDLVEGRIKPPRDVNASVPPALEAVIMRCLRTRPDERYQNADELARALEAVAAELGVEATDRAVVTDWLAVGQRPTRRVEQAELAQASSAFDDEPTRVHQRLDPRQADDREAERLELASTPKLPMASPSTETGPISFRSSWTLSGALESRAATGVTGVVEPAEASWDDGDDFTPIGSLAPPSWLERRTAWVAVPAVAAVAGVLAALVGTVF